MREICTSGSEGGGTRTNESSLPLFREAVPNRHCFSEDSAAVAQVALCNSFRSMTHPRDVECCRERAIDVEHRIGKSPPVAGAEPRPDFEAVHQLSPRCIERDVFHESMQRRGF